MLEYQCWVYNPSHTSILLPPVLEQNADASREGLDGAC